MTIVLIGLPVLVAVYVLLVAMRALALKITPRPYSIEWTNDYVLRATRIKKALLFALVILALNAFLFLPSPLMKVGDYHTAALFGVVDLVCILVVFGLLRWLEMLVRLVLRHTQYDV